MNLSTHDPNIIWKAWNSSKPNKACFVLVSLDDYSTNCQICKHSQEAKLYWGKDPKKPDQLNQAEVLNPPTEYRDVKDENSQNHICGPKSLEIFTKGAAEQSSSS